VLLRATRVRIGGRAGAPVATMETGAVKAAGIMTGVMAGTGTITTIIIATTTEGIGAAAAMGGA